MSTTARKARKSAGIPFTKPAKTGTPVSERSFVTEPVMRGRGDAMPAGMKYSPLTPRSPRRARAFIASGGRPNVALPKGRA